MPGAEGPAEQARPWSLLARSSPSSERQKYRQSHHSTGQRKIRATWRKEDPGSAEEVLLLNSASFTCLCFCLSSPLEGQLREGRGFYLSCSLLDSPVPRTVPGTRWVPIKISVE